MPVLDRKSTQKLRQEIAQLAARLIAEGGHIDYMTAKKKAALQLGKAGDKNIPTNLEVEEALIEYQQLFQRDSQPQQLLELRRCAINAMQLLSEFRPLLVGPVLTGTATRHSEVTLHIYCDEPEQIGFLLDEYSIPCTVCERSVRLNSTCAADYPAYRFIADGMVVVLVIFPERQRNFAPYSPINGRPMQRAAIDKVKTLIMQPL